MVTRRTGRGLASEIGRVLLLFGFDGLGLHRLCARYWVQNASSRHAMAKLGLREGEVLREDVVARGGERWSSLVGATPRTHLR